MLQEILIANKKNIHGRFYTKKSLETIILDHKRDLQIIGHSFGVFRDEPDFVEYGDRGIINLKDVAFIVEDLRIKKNSLLGKIKILETPKGKLLKKNKKNLIFRTTVWGNINDDGEVQVERLVSFNAIYKENDSFKEQEYDIS